MVGGNNARKEMTARRNWRGISSRTSRTSRTNLVEQRSAGDWGPHRAL